MQLQLVKFNEERENFRNKHSNDLVEAKRSFEATVAALEANHARIVEDYQERDRAWQVEKEEVLAEIQRLKEEASRFIAILSQEEEYYKSDQQLSPAKKQALTKEVESLQVISLVLAQDMRQFLSRI